MSVSLENILIVGSKRTGAIELAYARALQRQGIHCVEHFDLEQPGRLLAGSRIVNRLSLRMQEELTGRALYRYLRSDNQSYSAVIVFKGMLLTPIWLARCKGAKPRATWININPDDPFNLVSHGSTNQDVIKAIKQYDIYGTWGAHLIPKLQSAGSPLALYLPFGYDVEEHFPATTRAQEMAGVISFVGGWDKQREQVMTALSDFPLRIYGEGWNRISSRSPLRGRVYSHNLYGGDLRQVVTSSKASLNILRPQNYGAHNMRTFEIPAMRGLMVTTYSEEQERFFPQGKACLMYKDIQDLRDIIRAVLTDAINVPQMKETAHNLCHGQSYDDRARYLVEAIAAF